jgi:molybdopterin converting factor small subunit
MSLQVAAGTLAGVLAALSERFPEAARLLQPAPGVIEPAVRVVVNDIVVAGASPSRKIADGDRLAFVPIVGGGGSPPRQSR